MSHILIVARKKQWENIRETFKYRHEDVITKSKTCLEVDNGHKINRIELKPPDNSIKAYKPDVLILKTDVNRQYYNEIISPMKGFGAVIIDESKRTSTEKK